MSSRSDENRELFPPFQNINSYNWGMTDTFGLDNIDDLVMQSKKIMDDSDDSGNSTGLSSTFAYNRI